MLLFTLSQKSVTRALQRASWATQQQFLQLHPTIYIVTLYTPGYLEISWDVFAKKSADILSCRNSFITISIMYVLRAVENTQRSSKGSNHSRSKQRTDQRVLTLKFLALKNWFFPRKKYFTKILWLLFTFILWNFSVQTLQYFQKNFKLISCPWKL